jgi:flagella basal body P-ring formation protein FlgA
MRRIPLLALLVVLVAVAIAAAAPAAPTTTVAGDTVARLAHQWLAERLAGEVEPTGIQVQGAPRDLAMPAGETSFNLSLQSGSVAAGAMTVLVEAAVTDARGARTTRSTTVAFRVNALVDVVVAVRELPRRTLVGATDVRRERRPLARVPLAAVHDPAEVVGKETTRGMAPGEVLTASSLTTPLLIRRGSVVSLVIEGQNFRIVARGVAAEDGALGAPIRVINQSSRREVMGRVEDERTVRVSF